MPQGWHPALHWVTLTEPAELLALPGVQAQTLQGTAPPGLKVPTWQAVQFLMSAVAPPGAASPLGQWVSSHFVLPGTSEYLPDGHR